MTAGLSTGLEALSDLGCGPRLSSLGALLPSRPPQISDMCSQASPHLPCPLWAFPPAPVSLLHTSPQLAPRAQRTHLTVLRQRSLAPGLLV